MLLPVTSLPLVDSRNDEKAKSVHVIRNNEIINMRKKGGKKGTR